jgi:AcrR family transcriptional regulator
MTHSAHFDAPTPVADDAPIRPRETKRGEARRRAFLDAARDVFLAQGFEAASVNEVVRIAGGSLATLYGQFGSKEGLFLAMVEDAIGQVLAPMGEVAASHRPLRDGLSVIGETFLEAVLRPGAVALYRIVMSEGAKFPDVVRNYQALGPDRVRGVVRAYLEERKQAGELREVDCDAAAMAFLDLVASTIRARANWDPAFDLDDLARAAHVRRVVDFMILGLAVRS